jgi:hypothetical protein
MSAPYRILSLVEQASEGHNEGRSDGGPGEATQAVAGWLEANPGRWFIVGEVERYTDSGTAITVGLDKRSMLRNGFEAQTVNNKLYARLADASGLPLSDFVTRKRPTSYHDPLPSLTSDPFGWTIAELSDACVTAYEWLSGGRQLEAA